MREIWKKHKIPITITAYLGIMAALFFFALSPLIDGIKESSDEVLKKRIENEIGQSRINKLPELREGYAIYEQEKDSLDVILSEENSVDFIKKMEYLAEESGNKISLGIEDAPSGETKPKSSKNKADPESIRDNLPSDKYLSMKLVLEGNYEGFMNFLHKLENFEYNVNVISLDLSKEIIEEKAQGNKPGESAETAKKNVLVSTLEIVVYTK